MSDDFDRFLKSNFFDNPYAAWHDGVDLPRLVCLQGDELAQAEALLLKAMPDSRAIEGLGAIRSEKAVDPLRKLLRDNAVGVAAAVALIKINGDGGGVDVVIQALKNSRGHWSSRMDAAIALRNFRTKAAVMALFDALADPEMLVNFHAKNSLLYLYRQINGRELSDSSDALGVRNEQKQAATLETFRRRVQDGTLFGD